MQSGEGMYSLSISKNDKQWRTQEHTSAWSILLNYNGHSGTTPSDKIHE